ncbi:MAG: hypothetical protein ACOC9B_04320 [Chloroflexota bacterium]
MGHQKNSAKRVILLIIIALLVLSACVPQTTPDTALHKDPSTVRSSYSVAHLLLQVGAAIDSLEHEGETSRLLIAETDVSQLTLPPDMRHVWSRYRDLLGQLSDTIAALKESLTSAEDSLSRNRLEDVRVELDACVELLDRAKDQLKQLETATAEIVHVAHRLEGGRNATNLAKASASLDEAMERLRHLMQSYAERVQFAAESSAGKQHLISPELTCNLSHHSAWLGDSIVVSGNLSDSRRPLAGRQVSIMFNGDQIAGVTTDSQGSYSAPITVSFTYSPSARIEAAFFPGPDDAEQYRSAQSDACRITLRYHNTNVEVSPPGRLHPGLTVEVAGRLTSLGSVSSRLVTLYLDEVEVGAAFSEEDGSFRCALHVPRNAATGTKELAVIAQETETTATAPGETTMHVSVTQVTPGLAVRLPRALIYPLCGIYEGGAIRALNSQGGIELRAHVESPLPLGASVLAGTWNGEQLEEVAAGATVDIPSLPLHPLQTGWQDLQLELQDPQPWHTTATYHGRIFILNLYILIPGGLLFLLAAAWALYLRRRPAPSVAYRATVPARRTSPAEPLPALPPDHSLSPRYAVVRWYWTAVSTCTNHVGLVIPRSVTMREAAEMIVGRMPFLGRLVGTLTSLAEEALYSTRPIPRRQASTARWLNIHIARALNMPLEETSEGET